MSLTDPAAIKELHRLAINAGIDDETIARAIGAIQRPRLEAEREERLKQLAELTRQLGEKTT